MPGDPSVRHGILDGPAVTDELAIPGLDASRPVHSPLRYPGGKSRLGPWMAWTMRENGLIGGVFSEAYCGGAGAAIYLLSNNYVSRIEINDLDPAIAAFWRSAVLRSREFIARIERIDVTLEERERQREILRRPERHSDLDLGFAAWFLNRVNRSGIIRGGPIGGTAGESRYDIDVRFNRLELIGRFRRLGELSDRIGIHERDALDFLDNEVPRFGGNQLAFLDPPYFHKSKQLYRNRYDRWDHEAVARAAGELDVLWIMTYDDCAEIAGLYEGMRQLTFSAVSYAGTTRSSRTELMIYGNLVLSCRPVARKSIRPYPAGYPSGWQ